MQHEVAWRLMFRVNDKRAAARCLADAVDKLGGATVTHELRPYWKMPELWEVSLRTGFASPISEAVLSLLLAADRLGSNWLVTGPLIVSGEVSVFEGIFDGATGRGHSKGLQWASFSVGVFSSEAAGA